MGEVCYIDLMNRLLKPPIKKVISENRLNTKLHVGIEVNYVEDIAPVTKEYIEESVSNVKEADGIIASWNLNTMPDHNIEHLLNAMEK